MKSSRRRWVCLGAAAGLAIAALSSSAWAVIEALTPLSKFVADATTIVVAKVERIDPSRPAVVFTVERTLKGSPKSPRLPLPLVGDEDGEPQEVLARLEPGLPLVLFLTEVDAVRVGYAYTNGTWIQLAGTVDGENTRWRYTHNEPYLRRTYLQPTADLVALLTDHLAGKAELPPANEKEKPGLGPPLAQASAGNDAPVQPAPAEKNPALPNSEPDPKAAAKAAQAEAERGWSPWVVYGIVAFIVLDAIGMLIVVAVLKRRKAAAP